jgi:VanZ family protein
MGVGFPGMDKVGHFILFAVLGATLAWGARDLRKGAAHGGLLLAGTLFAASDELHQAFVPSRTPSVGDFVADVLGLVVGYLVIRAVLLRWARNGEASVPS